MTNDFIRLGDHRDSVAAEIPVSDCQLLITFPYEIFLSLSKHCLLSTQLRAVIDDVIGSETVVAVQSKVAVIFISTHSLDVRAPQFLQKKEEITQAFLVCFLTLSFGKCSMISTNFLRRIMNSLTRVLLLRISLMSRPVINECTPTKFPAFTELSFNPLP